MQQETPKPAPVRLNYAHPLFRVYAFVLDIGLLYVLIIVTKRLFGELLWHPTAAPQDIAIILIYFVVPTAVAGRTFGKWALRIKVVDKLGNPPGILAIPREIFGRVAATVLLGIGLIWILFNKQRQGWHDKLAMTYVVYANKPLLSEKETKPQKPPKSSKTARSPSPPRMNRGKKKKKHQPSQPRN